MLIDHPTIRLYLYLIGLTALAIAPLIALWQPEIATAIRDGANIFGATALGTAALNTPQRTPTTSGRHLAPPPHPSQQPPPPKAWPTQTNPLIFAEVGLCPGVATPCRGVVKMRCSTPPQMWR